MGAASLGHVVDEPLAAQPSRLQVVRPHVLVADPARPPAPEVLDPAVATDVRIALEVEEDVARVRRRQPRVAASPRRLQVAMRRLAALTRTHLKRRLMTQQLKALRTEPCDPQLRRSDRERRDRLDPGIDQLLALIAARIRDKAQVIDRAQLLLALSAEDADLAVRDRLGRRRRRRLRDQLLKPRQDSPVQCRVPAKIDRAQPPRFPARATRSAARAPAPARAAARRARADARLPA